MHIINTYFRVDRIFQEFGIFVNIYRLIRYVKSVYRKVNILPFVEQNISYYKYEKIWKTNSIEYRHKY